MRLPDISGDYWGHPLTYVVLVVLTFVIVGKLVWLVR